MSPSNASLARYRVNQQEVDSIHLGRRVVVDTYLPNDVFIKGDISLLIVNDGQDLPHMPLAPMIEHLASNNEIIPLLVVGLYCNHDRKLEYGTADVLDYMGRGSKAALHRSFIINELIPYLRNSFNVAAFKDVSIAGFSLGGLSALDIAWKHPEIFSRVGVFSGSFWWRSKALNDGYEEDRDRIMHQLIRTGKRKAPQQFFFQTGALDETADRNNNGIIDSIDDTLDIITELEKKGFEKGKDIRYFEMADGRHDVATWGKAFPEFLKWGWGK